MTLPNVEPCGLYRPPSIIREVKSRRPQWGGYDHRIQERLAEIWKKKYVEKLLNLVRFETVMA
jgi:hypothetical protein